MARQFARILYPSDPWFQEPGDVAQLAVEFAGVYDDGTSVCDLTVCSAELALAAFYGNTTRPTPTTPAWLSFTDEEVLGAGGLLHPSPAEPPWPSEYSNAHHNVVGNRQAVANAVVTLARAEPHRRRVVDRAHLVSLIVELSQRRDAPPKFMENTRKRMRRIHREELDLFEQVAAILPVVRTMLLSTK